VAHSLAPEHWCLSAHLQQVLQQIYLVRKSSHLSLCLFERKCLGELGRNQGNTMTAISIFRQIMAALCGAAHTLRNGHTDAITHNDYLAPRDQLIVRVNPDRIVMARIKIDHRPTSHFQQGTDRHLRASQHDRNLNLDFFEYTHNSAPVRSHPGATW
jgi:hypothetical protein